MCRLLGVVFRGRFPIDTLCELKILSEIGRVPGEERRGHRDGWGIASFRESGPYYLGRSARPAFSDQRYNASIEAADHIAPPNILIAHVRAASTGSVSIDNSHPFIFGGLVFAHNGTVKDLPEDGRGRQRGGTDSERLAILLADRMEEKKALPSALKSVVKEEIDKRDFTAAIIVASDGKSLVGYRDFSNPELSGYYSLRIAKCEDSVSLFQEIAVGCEGERTDLGKRQLVEVTRDLKIRTETL